jgi:hypothetical protein
VITTEVGLSELIVALDISPHVPGCESEWFVELVVSLSVNQEVSCSHLGAVKRLVGHAFLYESLKSHDGLLSRLWVNVVLSDGVGHLAPPGLSSNEFLVHIFIADNVHVVPPPVEVVLIVLLMHPHMEHGVNWEVECVCRADHLAVVNESEVGGGHTVEVLAILVGHNDDTAGPFSLAEVLSDPSLTRASSVQADDSDEVSIEWEGLWGQGGGCGVLEQEFLDSLAQVLHAELDLVHFVAWGQEDGVGVLVDAVLLSELAADAADALLHLGGEESLVCKEVVALVETTQMLT